MSTSVAVATGYETPVCLVLADHKTTRWPDKSVVDEILHYVSVIKENHVLFRFEQCCEETEFTAILSNRSADQPVHPRRLIRTPLVFAALIA